MPDAWGRALVKLEGKRAFSPRPTNDADHLQGVDDALRFGALRFRDEQGVFVRPSNSNIGAAPRLLTLPRLLAAADAVGRRAARDDDLQTLLGPGSSLGGARPKCVVIKDDGTQALAKFPTPGEDGLAVKAEVLALRLADRIGLRAPPARVVMAGQRAIALIDRFDRTARGRLHCLSAQTLLDAPTASGGNYRDIADALREHGANPALDLTELFLRMTYTVLVSNCDDHLRNHAFMEAPGGRYRFTPLYDVNPTPDRIKVVKTELTRGSGEAATIEALIDEPQDFGMKPDYARTLVREFATLVAAHWRSVAEEVGMNRREIGEIAPAFDHTEASKALRLGARTVVGKEASGIGD